MPNIAFCNVGNSDLYADNKIIRPARPEGKRYWETYAEHQFSAPILDAYIEYLRLNNITINLLILFDTDQAENETTIALDRFNVKLRDKDTLWFGKILQRYISQQWNHIIEQVECRTICDINPSFYDEAMEEFGKQLQSVPSHNDNKYFVFASGGTQAFNNALQFKAIARFRDRCHVLYKSENDLLPYPLKISSQLLSSFNISTAILLIEQANFLGALTLLEGLIEPAAIELLRYAKFREDFNFNSAQAILEKLQFQVTGTFRGLVRKIHENQYQVDHKNLAFLLVELYYNAKIAYDNGRYVDFLGRIFRFQEAVLRYMVEQIYNISTDMNVTAKNATTAQFQALIQEDPDLYHYLENKFIGDSKLDYSQFSLRVMECLVKFALEKSKKSYLDKKDKGLYQGAFKLISLINELSSLRNQSIIAHGFEGVSQSQIDEAFRGKAYQNPPDVMYEILNKIMIPIHDNPYTVIQTALVTYLYNKI